MMVHGKTCCIRIIYGDLYKNAVLYGNLERKGGGLSSREQIAYQVIFMRRSREICYPIMNTEIDCREKRPALSASVLPVVALTSEWARFGEDAYLQSDLISLLLSCVHALSASDVEVRLIWGCPRGLMFLFNSLSLSLSLSLSRS